jgi:hypothetical protein
LTAPTPDFLVATTTQAYDQGDVIDGALVDLALRKGLGYNVQQNWLTDVDAADIPHCVMTYEDREHGINKRLFKVNRGGLDSYATLSLRSTAGGTRVKISICSEYKSHAEKVLEYAQSLFPVAAVDKDKIRVKFWMSGKHGPESINRSIDAPTFEAIQGNYTGHVASALARMVSPEFEPGRGGQLLLWHGPPGTGKTFALRALAVEWRKWCNIEYIVDPDAFFGSGAYLMHTIMSESERMDEYDDAEEKWRLLIFEDTGDLLAADARERTGQGLSRLLNLVDGFIGQGLRTLILITTNDELGKLHPAVSRPGRCAVQIKFDEMSGPESQAWGKANGISVPRKPHKLASLFALREGYDNAEDPQVPIGFQVA